MLERSSGVSSLQLFFVVVGGWTLDVSPQQNPCVRPTRGVGGNGGTHPPPRKAVDDHLTAPVDPTSVPLGLNSNPLGLGVLADPRTECRPSSGIDERGKDSPVVAATGQSPAPHPEPPHQDPGLSWPVRIYYTIDPGGQAKGETMLLGCSRKTVP